MGLSRDHSLSFPSLVLLLPAFVSALSINCDHERIGGKDYNLNALDGPHIVWTIDDHPPTYTNTTFTIDICRPLQKTKGVPKDEDCPNGSRVCAIERLYNPVEEDAEPRVERTVPIAGDFSTSSGGALDPLWSSLEDDAGLRLELHGGKYQKQKQKAIVDLLCKKEDGKSNRRSEKEHSGEIDEEAGKTQDDGHGGTLKYISWDIDSDDTKVLKLEWITKVACEGNSESDSGGSSKHWGFFTWLIIILFLGVATYLIFGSWLNYNRYSARGWDVLPHSDTIQDLPYLFKDWVRRVINTVQGGGSRGGYSAV